MLALCARGELTVTELTQILGQSQPRVSRHLRLLCEAGLLDRFREGTFVFYRLAETGRGADLARHLIEAIPADDAQACLDMERLGGIKHARAESAADYFRRNADRWHEIRSLHVPESAVEDAILRLLPAAEGGDVPAIDELLDIGTGTGRMLEVLGPHVRRAVGVDMSREMLAIARANLEASGQRHCQVRQADMYQLPFTAASFDAAVIHQVLHYAEEPAAMLAEAARVLRPGGLLLVVDFAPHLLETLRTEHAHRRLGFSDEEVALWCRQAGLVCQPVVHLPGDPLTVTVWPALRNGDRTIPLLPSTFSHSGAQP